MSLTSSSAAGGLLAAIRPNDHFLSPRPPETLPWEMEFEERKRHSNDPRMVKHTRDEAQWATTVAASIWPVIRRFAKSKDDFVMTRDQLAEMLRYAGITGATLLSRLLSAFDPMQVGKVNGLILCKYLETAIVDVSPHQDAFIDHCFNKYDRPGFSEEVSIVLLETIPVLDLKAFPNGKLPKKLPAPLTTPAGATFAMIEALKIAARNQVAVNSTPDLVSPAAFKALMTDPTNHALVGAHLVSLLEVAARLWGPPRGRLPLLKPLWLATTEPAKNAEELFDADILLLRQIEANDGIDPFAKPKGKKKAAPASPKK